MSKHKNDYKSPKGNTVSPSGPEPGSSLAAAADGLGREVDAAPASSVPEPEPLTVELESARGEIASLRAELAELNEKYLRKLADEVNFRKRMLREKEETQKYAVASLLGDLVPILDDFDRGLASVESTKNNGQLGEGVALIRKQLSQMLENKYSLKRFESKGTPFDPNRHEALFAEPADVEEPIVSEEYLPGYALHDRILRTAKVRVKIPGPTKAKDAGAADTVGQA